MLKDIPVERRATVLVNFKFHKDVVKVLVLSSIDLYMYEET